MGPHRAIKRIGDAMRREMGDRRTAPRRRPSPPPRRGSPPPRRTSPGRTRGAPGGRGGLGSGAGGRDEREAKELALARPGGGGRRSASKDRRGKEKERRKESRGRREAEAMVEREKEDRGAGRNPGTARKKSAYNFPGLNLGGTAFPLPSRDICYPKAAGGEPEP